MTLDHTIRRHPTRYQLVAFVESRLDGRSPVSAAMASHVATCALCEAEVKSIRASLEFTASAPGLEPSNNLTGQILLNAQRERRNQTQEHRRSLSFTAVLRGVAYTAALATTALLVFGAALNNGTLVPVVQSAVPQIAESAPSPDLLKRTAEEVQALAAAVRPGIDRAQSPLERRRMQAVSAMDADIAAAMSALQRNPGCARATHIVNANLRRQAETLRNLYVDRQL